MTLRTLYDVGGRSIFFRTLFVSALCLSALTACQTTSKSSSQGITPAGDPLSPDPFSVVDPEKNDQQSGQVPPAGQHQASVQSQPPGQASPPQGTAASQPQQTVGRSLPNRPYQQVAWAFKDRAIVIRSHPKPDAKRFKVDRETLPRFDFKGRKGTPIYGETNGYMEVLLPDYSTGWVPQYRVSSSAPPCKIVPSSLTRNSTSGAVSSGLGDYACQ